MRPTWTPSFANRPVVPLSVSQQALLDAVRTERDAMYFYLRAAHAANDGRARRVFEKLAAEERQHVEWFLETYAGEDIPDLQVYLDQGRDGDNSWLEELEETLAGEGSDLEALDLAMRKEEQLERQLRQQSASLTDPQLRRVYEVNADSTHQHYQTIRAELLRLSSEQKRES